MRLRRRRHEDALAILVQRYEHRLAQKDRVIEAERRRSRDLAQRLDTWKAIAREHAANAANVRREAS